jgi:hypothetical protein
LVTPGDGWDFEDDVEVESLHWIKVKGGEESKGTEVSKKVYDRVEKYSQYWQAYVSEQVFDYVACEQYEDEAKAKAEAEATVQLMG